MLPTYNNLGYTFLFPKGLKRIYRRNNWPREDQKPAGNPPNPIAPFDIFIFTVLHNGLSGASSRDFLSPILPQRLSLTRKEALVTDLLISPLWLKSWSHMSHSQVQDISYGSMCAQQLLQHHTCLNTTMLPATTIMDSNPLE